MPSVPGNGAFTSRRAHVPPARAGARSSSTRPATLSSTDSSTWRCVVTKPSSDRVAVGVNSVSKRRPPARNALASVASRLPRGQVRPPTVQSVLSLISSRSRQNAASASSGTSSGTRRPLSISHCLER